MKTLIRIIVVVLIVWVIWAIFRGSIGSAENEQKLEPTYRAEPTGCVHGDSIPMNMCSKFDEAVPITQSSPEPEDTSDIVGK